MSRKAQVPMGAASEKEVREYLQEHPEVERYFAQLSRVEQMFGRFLRLTAAPKIVRDLPSGSTVEVELNGSVSRTGP